MIRKEGAKICHRTAIRSMKALDTSDVDAIPPLVPEIMEAFEKVMKVRALRFRVLDRQD
jgi:hypothetical protein